LIVPALSTILSFASPLARSSALSVIGLVALAVVMVLMGWTVGT